jgi:Fe-S cluster assembly scaffold protein SufB
MALRSSTMDHPDPTVRELLDAMALMENRLTEALAGRGGEQTPASSFASLFDSFEGTITSSTIALQYNDVFSSSVGAAYAASPCARPRSPSYDDDEPVFDAWPLFDEEPVDSATTQALFSDDADHCFGDELDTDRTMEFCFPTSEFDIKQVVAVVSNTKDTLEFARARRVEIRTRVTMACEDWVVDHNVDAATVADMAHLAHDYFTLPPEDKPPLGPYIDTAPSPASFIPQLVDTEEEDEVFHTSPSTCSTMVPNRDATTSMLAMVEATWSDNEYALVDLQSICYYSTSKGICEYPDLVRHYLGSVVLPGDNYYVALNSVVFSDGSFSFVPKDTVCPMEISTYFRINDKETNQFERTLIVADERCTYVLLIELCLQVDGVKVWLPPWPPPVWTFWLLYDVCSGMHYNCRDCAWFKGIWQPLFLVTPFYIRRLKLGWDVFLGKEIGEPRGLKWLAVSSWNMAEKMQKGGKYDYASEFLEFADEFFSSMFSVVLSTRCLLNCFIVLHTCFSTAISIPKLGDADNGFAGAILEDQIFIDTLTSRKEMKGQVHKIACHLLYTMLGHVHKTASNGDKRASLHSDRRTWGLCDRCLEKWSYGQKCTHSVQLHVVDGVLELVSTDSETRHHGIEGPQLRMTLSQAACSGSDRRQTLKFRGSLQSIPLLILVGSGSSYTFVINRFPSSLPGVSDMISTESVQVDNREIMSCQHYRLTMEWFIQDYKFVSNISLLPLSKYNLVVNRNWLEAYSHMSTGDGYTNTRELRCCYMDYLPQHLLALLLKSCYCQILQLALNILSDTTPVHPDYNFVKLVIFAKLSDYSSRQMELQYFHKNVITCNQFRIMLATLSAAWGQAAFRGVGNVSNTYPGDG